MSHKDQAAGDPEGYQLEVVQYGPQVDQEDHEQPWLFTFLHCPGIDATNNAGEREMRPAVIARKTWGGNRIEAGREAQRTFNERVAHLLSARQRRFVNALWICCARRTRSC